MVKHLPTNAGDPVQSLDWEDPLEKEMAAHCSIFCLGNPKDRGALQAIVHGLQKCQTQRSN